MNIDATEVFEELVDADNSNKYRQLVCYGGSRSSKSWSIMQLMMVKLVESKIKITVWRNEKVTCRGTIMEDFKNILYSDIDLYNIFMENKAKGSFTNKLNGSVIVFEGADNIGKVLGMTQDISVFNEITEFNEYVYLQITQRTSGTIYADYNPSKRFWFERMKRREDTLFMHSYFLKNAFCPEEIVIQLKSYEPWETGSYEVVDGVPMYKGKPISPRNQPPPHKKNVEEGTANEYYWLVYGLGLEAEKPNKIYHGWKMISDELYHMLPYKTYYGLDFGSSNPNAFVEVKFDGEKTFYVHELLYEPGNNIKTSLSEVLSEILGDEKATSMIVADSAKKAMVTALKQEGFHAIAAKKGPGSVSLGINYLQGFNIVYTKSSKNIDIEQSLYSWILDRYGKATDDPEKKNDHILDAIRYVITFLVRYLNIKVKI